MHRMAKREVKQAERLQRPQYNTFSLPGKPAALVLRTTVAAFQEGLIQEEHPKDSRLGIRDESTCRKHGCFSGFTATKLYPWPDVVQLGAKHVRRTNVTGNPHLLWQPHLCSGCLAYHAPFMPCQMKEWNPQSATGWPDHPADHGKAS
ncbi:hypothetical protein ABBQ32_008809 [Trebouxia sp. C0010 RCD-2024]